jgi:pimeloyl-ACP methyl ester carboxylesterase
MSANTSWLAGALSAVAMLAGCAQQAPFALQDMGSFHIGGREVEIKGRPVKEVLFTPGSVPAKVAPNGIHQVEQMYVQYFIPANRRGALPILMWHGGGLTGVTYETTQAGQFGFRVAQARPDLVRTLVLVEPAGIGDIKAVERLKDVPTLAIYGDYIEQDARWPTIRGNGVKFLEAAAKLGARYEVVDLPKAGIRGNSHMMMMDRNNGEIAQLIQNWLEKQGLYR